MLAQGTESEESKLLNGTSLPIKRIGYEFCSLFVVVNFVIVGVTLFYSVKNIMNSYRTVAYNTKLVVWSINMEGKIYFAFTADYKRKFMKSKETKKSFE